MTQAALDCKPNFSGAGRLRRLRIGVLFAVLSVALAATFIVLHVAWYLRLSLFIPVAATTITLLQVSRNTCVAHAAKGTFEHDDFSTSPQSQDEVAASRRVAATIYRDAVLAGLAAAAFGAVTILIR